MAPRGPKDLTTEDRRLWDRITGTVQPPRKRKALRIAEGATTPERPIVPAPVKAPPKFVRPARPGVPPTPAAPAPPRAHVAPDVLEPRRQRRLSRELDPIEARIDLHGFGRFEAEDQLTGFLLGAHARGLRAVLVITGQGRRGGGVIRASVHEWLQSPRLRGVISGFAWAHRRHGGDGAIYVTLKRRV